MLYLQPVSQKNVLNDLQTLILNQSKLINNFNNLDSYFDSKIDEMLAQKATKTPESNPNTVIATSYSFKGLPPKLPKLSNRERTLAKIKIFNLLYK